MNGLTRAVAVDYAEQGIRCNTISPGYVVNDRRDANLDDEPERRARYVGMHLTRLGDRRRRRARRGLPRQPGVGVRHGHQPAARRRQQHRPRTGAGMNATNAHNPRVSVSAICMFQLDLAEQVEFWQRHGIRRVGVSVAKLESDAAGFDDALALVERSVRDGTIEAANLIGLGSFVLAEPSSWPAARQAPDPRGRRGRAPRGAVPRVDHWPRRRARRGRRPPTRGARRWRRSRRTRRAPA